MLIDCYSHLSMFHHLQWPSRATGTEVDMNNKLNNEDELQVLKKHENEYVCKEICTEVRPCRHVLVTSFDAVDGGLRRSDFRPG